MRKLIGVTSLIFLLSPVASLANDQGCANNGDPVAIEKVRAQRQVFNQAIAEKDLQSIESVLDKNVLLLTGTDSDLYSGVDAQLAIWRDDFSREDRAVYKRTPGCIRVSPVAPVALEYGTWRGEKVNAAGDFAAGSYAAKWRKANGRWRLESEIFATEACNGGFCPAREP